MFGCLVSGRIVQANAQQVDANRFVFACEKANQIQHIAVFLLGTVALPEGYGASIFFGWPPYQDWKYLGYLTNAKPSAIFRLQTKSGGGGGIDVDMGMERDENVVAQIGISIEPINLIESRTQGLTSNTSNNNITASTGNSSSSTNTALVPIGGGSNQMGQLKDMQDFALKMCENLFNYLRSFASQSTGDMIPSSALDKWYENFQRKMKNDPFFWKNST